MTKTYYPNIPRSGLGFILQDLKENLLVIASDERDAALLAEKFNILLPNKKILSFPSWDIQPYDRISPHIAIMARRLRTLHEISSIQEDYIVITTIKALQQKIINKNILNNYLLKITVQDEIDRDQLISYLFEIGFNRSSIASEIGDFAVRGSIIDIILEEDYGYRIDFFGNTIESIKKFEIITQKSVSIIDHLEIIPVNEVILNSDNINNFKNNYRSKFGNISNNDILYETIAASSKFAGMENWLPLFYNQLSSPLEYFDKFTLVYFEQDLYQIEDNYRIILETFNLRQKFQNHEEFTYNPIDPSTMWLASEEFLSQISEQNSIIFSPNIDPDKSPILRSDFILPNQKKSFEYLKEYQSSKKEKLVICAESLGSQTKIFELLHHNNIFPYKIQNLASLKNVSGKTIGVIHLPIEEGFKYKNYTFISEQELLGYKIRRRKKQQDHKKAENFLLEASNLNPGELIVHKDYGIGKFLSLEPLEVKNHIHDCVKIEYAGGDKLYIPVENIDVISRYGSENAELDKLGSLSWQTRTAKLKKRIKIEADAILKIAAERSIKKAAICTPPEGIYDEFCARFPYPETEDQLKAIEDIINDLESGRPMDRLICGDVGFGKTEVAMRAAFIVASSQGNIKRRQVAIIVPTTLLARQHFRNFSERFRDMNIRIAMLSRLISAKEAKQIKADLENGNIDIIIATHSILSKNVKFHNLTLLIIDEEQHFGVIQKERIKDLKANIHVLTLSATPIPRTLYMSLSGLKDLSLIASPPIDRLAVKTFVMPYDSVIIREAIINEKSRGGKIFYVCPRIKDIEDIKKKLDIIVPEIRMEIAHGQMTPSQIDTIMNDFYDGKFDLLISTTIVESGLDIASANTIIIHRADMFGLAQLYQLRGRVGRGKQRGFAYLTTPKGKLSSEATKRLEVMQKLDSLGAGFTIASHDMDIRGFGNILGDEQSGNIKEVGVELYQEMLSQAIEELKNNDENNDIQNAKTPPQINIGLSIQIPETYIEDINLRLNLYRRIAAIHNKEELDGFYSEMIDRFGPMPESVQHLFTIIELKQMCLEAGISKIDSGPKAIVFSFYDQSPKYYDALMVFINKSPHNTKLRPDNKFVISGEFSDSNKIIQFAKSFMQSIMN